MMPYTLRIIRALNLIQKIKGGTRLLMSLLPKSSIFDVIVHNRSGKFVCDMNSFIERRLAILGDYEREEKKLFSKFVSEGRRGILLDVGANIGSHSIYFSAIFDRVISFEPNPEMFARLKSNIELNEINHIDAFMVGLGNERRTMEFYQPAKGFGNKGTGTFEKSFAPERSNTLYLPIIPGDEFLSEHGIFKVDAIKIDVQGFEVRVLQGLEGVILRDKPIIWLEISDTTLGEISQAGGLRALLPQGYQLKRFSAGARAWIWYKNFLEDIPSGEPSEAADYLLVPLV